MLFFTPGFFKNAGDMQTYAGLTHDVTDTGHHKIYGTVREPGRIRKSCVQRISSATIMFINMDKQYWFQ